MSLQHIGEAMFYGAAIVAVAIYVLSLGLDAAVAWIGNEPGKHYRAFRFVLICTGLLGFVLAVSSLGAAV